MYMQLYMYMYVIEGEVIISYPRERNIRERGCGHTWVNYRISSKNLA